MIDLKKLFVARGTQYQTVTRKILTELKSSRVAMEQYLELGDNQSISWEDVGLVDNNDEGQEVVLVTGISKFDLGAKVTTTQGEIVISEKNQNTLRQVYRIGIPLEMVIRDSSEEILAFLLRKRAEVQAQAKAQAEAASEPVQIPVSPVDNQPFDLSALTEEQRASLELYNLSRTKN